MSEYTLKSEAGQRASVMIIAGTPVSKTGMDRHLEIASEFASATDWADPESVALFAVASADTLQADLTAPTGENPRTPAEFIDAIVADGAVRHRADHSLCDWAMVYHDAIAAASPESLCGVWDIYPTGTEVQA